MEKRKQLPNILAERLKTYRKVMGLTQKEMSEQLKKRGVDITQQSYARYENNNASPDYDTLIKLAVILKTDVNSLVGFDVSEEAYFNRVTHGKMNAVRDGDNVIIKLDGKTFSMPLQEFKEDVDEAKLLAANMTRMEYEKIFYESMFLDFVYYLTRTQYATVAKSSEQDNLQLEKFMQNNLHDVAQHFKDTLARFNDWAKDTKDKK